eukprot:2429606-Prymnesium_polylepis.1
MATSLARRVGPLTSLAVSAVLLLAHGLFAFAQFASALQDCPTLPGLPNFTSVCDGTNDNLLARFDAGVQVGFEAEGLVAAALGVIEQQ